MIFVSYLITNVANGKKYIGITTGPLARRWRQHKHHAKSRKPTYLGRAINKYGISSFSMEVIASSVSLYDLFDLERILIAQHQTKSPLGYNLTGGGDGLFDPDAETRFKIGTGRRGKKLTAAHIEALRAARTGQPGTPLTLERRMALALSQGSLSARANKSAGMKKSVKAIAHIARVQSEAIGRKRSLASRQRTSEAQRARFQRCPQQPPSVELLARLVAAANDPKVLEKKSQGAIKRWARVREAKELL